MSMFIFILCNTFPLDFKESFNQANFSQESQFLREITFKYNLYWKKGKTRQRCRKNH